MQAESGAENKKVAIRALVITTMFSIFISLVVFVVATYFFLVPLLTHQQLQIQALNHRLSAVEAAQSEPPAPPAAQVAAAPANPVVHASAPAPAPGGPAAVPAKAPGN